jgi:hypothetical protein
MEPVNDLLEGLLLNRLIEPEGAGDGALRGRGGLGGWLCLGGLARRWIAGR